MPKVLLADSIWVINFIPKDTEWDLAQLFHCKEGIELGFRLREAFVIFCVDEEHDPGDFGEVIFPQTTG